MDNLVDRESREQDVVTVHGWDELSDAQKEQNWPIIADDQRSRSAS